MAVWARGAPRRPVMTRMMMRVAIVVSVVVLGAAGAGAAPACPAPRVAIGTTVGITYCSDPAFDAAIDGNVQKIRQDVRAQRQAGRLIVYASTPIGPRGGGVEKVNIEIAASVKARLEKAYGAGVWVLDPGAYQMAKVGNKAPGGGEYMVMWTQVLSGDDGAGRDFDMVHFTGPGDMRAFFGCAYADLTGCLGRWLTARGATDPDLRKVADDQEARH